MPVLEAFTTERLEAWPLTPDDYPELIRMHRDPDVMALLGGVREDHQTAEYLARNLQHWADYGYGLWIVRERNGERAIGRAALRHLTIDGIDEVEVGYAFYREFWGRGLATEIAAACVGLGQRHLNVPSLVAVTHPENYSSQHVLNKVGLIYDREIQLDGSPKALFRTRWPGAESR